MYLQFKSFEGVAQLTLKLAYGGQSHASQQLAEPNPMKLDFEAKPTGGNPRFEKVTIERNSMGAAKDDRAPTEELRASVRVLLFDWKADE